MASYDHKVFSEAAKHFFDTGNDSCEASKMLELHHQVRLVLEDSFDLSQDEAQAVIDKLAEAGVSFRMITDSVNDEENKNG
jgi:hypothetical protein